MNVFNLPCLTVSLYSVETFIESLLCANHSIRTAEAAKVNNTEKRKDLRNVEERIGRCWCLMKGGRQERGARLRPLQQVRTLGDPGKAGGVVGRPFDECLTGTENGQHTAEG